MPFDDKELEQLGGVFEKALDNHSIKREKAIEAQREKERAANWKPGDKERRSDPNAYGGRRKAPASDKDKDKGKKVRSIFSKAS